MAVAGLQGIPRAQIFFITAVQLFYVILILLEGKRKRTFKSLWLKVKVIL